MRKRFSLKLREVTGKFHILLLLPLLGFLSGCPVTQSQDVPAPQRRMVEPQTGAIYSIYVPSYHSNERTWPLVVTLHGSLLWDGHTRQIAEWKALAERKGFVVIAPKLQSAEGILPNVGYVEKLEKDEKITLAIIDHVTKKYNIDRGDPKTGRKPAIMLSGFSAGGYPLYWIGLRNPDRFNMLTARACNSDIRAMDRIRLSDEARKIPIFIFWGKDDLQPIQEDSWAAFRWLRRHRVYTTRKKEVRGGHLRRPDVAYNAWAPYLPAKLQRE